MSPSVEDPTGGLMGTAEIRDRLGVSRQRTDQITNHPSFPKPIATLAAGRIWRRVDIEAWIAQRRPNLDEPDES